MKIPRNLAFPKEVNWRRLNATHFPHDMCSPSRRLRDLSKALRKPTSELRAAVHGCGEDPDEIAMNIEATVASLWEARAELRRLDKQEIEL